MSVWLCAKCLCAKYPQKFADFDDFLEEWTNWFDFGSDPYQDPDPEIFEKIFNEIFGGVGVAKRTAN